MAEVLDDAISMVGSRVAMVAGPGVDNAFLTQVRKLVHSDDPFGLLVSAMTDAGLANIPSLACAVTERGGVRLIVRGSGKALVKTADGRSEILSARRVSTWSEHASSGVEEVVLVVPNAQGDQTSLVLFLDPAGQRRRTGRSSRAVRPSPAPAVAAPMGDWAPPAPSSPPVALPPPVAPAAAAPSFEPPVAPSVPQPPSPIEDEPELDFDHLVGETRYRSVEAAAVRPPIDDLPAFADVEVDEDTTFHPTSTAWDDGDHDGNTVSLSDLRDLTSSIPPVPRTTDAVVPQAPPVVGRLRFDDGQVVDLDRAVVLGRQPRFQGDHVGPGAAARLVTLADPEQALSRSHAEVRVEGWQVLVVDLGSTNGTTVHVPGRPPIELVGGVPHPLGPGDRVELADEVGFTFEAQER